VQPNNEIIRVEGIPISVVKRDGQDYVSLTDMAGYLGSEVSRSAVANWMSRHYTIDFLTVWEKVNNPVFNYMGSRVIKNEPGRLIVSVKKWVDCTNAIGLFSRTGRYNSGVFAHKDIAFEFGTWLSPEFKYYLILEFQRLQLEEQKRLSEEWNLHRALAKVNYRIHTDAIKEYLIPPELNQDQINSAYASEADMLNMALFGQTAAQWRTLHPDAPKKYNIRDEGALEQLIVLSNLESINALLIAQGLSQKERLVLLNNTAITQMSSLLQVVSQKQLPRK
jgi:hypothetical protein